jgi:hypothetical protein
MTKGHSGSAWFGDYGLKRGILMRAGRLCAASALGLPRESARFGHANTIDHFVIAITSAEVLFRHTAGWAGNSRAEVMIIATSGAKAPETPARRVVAWFPPPSAVRRGADGSVTILPPSGWAICDGTKGTSDFSNRFIIDGSRNEGIGSSAGSATQGANANVPPAGTGRAGGELAAAGHDRGVRTDPWESIPAFVTLIYIVKL